MIRPVECKKCGKRTADNMIGHNCEIENGETERITPKKT